GGGRGARGRAELGAAGGQAPRDRPRREPLHGPFDREPELALRAPGRDDRRPHLPQGAVAPAQGLIDLIPATEHAGTARKRAVPFRAAMLSFPPAARPPARA